MDWFERACLWFAAALVLLSIVINAPAMVLPSWILTDRDLTGEVCTLPGGGVGTMVCRCKGGLRGAPVKCACDCV